MLSELERVLRYPLFLSSFPFDMLKDLACFLFEGVLSIVATALSSIGSVLLSTLDIVQYFQCFQKMFRM